MGLKSDLLNELHKAEKRNDLEAVAFFQAQVDRLVKAKGDFAAGVQTTPFAIPESTRVRQGESVFSIAKRIYGADFERAAFDIIFANPDIFTFTDGAYNTIIHAGQTLRLPQGAVGGADVPTDASFREVGPEGTRIVNFGLTPGTVDGRIASVTPGAPISADVAAQEARQLGPGGSFTPDQLAPPIAAPTTVSPGGVDPGLTANLGRSTTPISPEDALTAGAASTFLSRPVGPGPTAPANLLDEVLAGEASRLATRTAPLTAQSIARETIQSQETTQEPSTSFIHQGALEIAGRFGTGVQAAAINAAIVTGNMPDTIPFGAAERLGMTPTELLARNFVPDVNTGMWLLQENIGTGGTLFGTGGFFRPTFGFQNNGFRRATKRTTQRRGSLPVPPKFSGFPNTSQTPGLIRWRITF